MPLLNYTTSVAVDRTLAQVQSLLVKAGARQMMTEFAENGTPAGLMFSIQTPQGLRAFTLPVEADRVQAVLRKDRAIQPRFKTPEHAERVAWRILKDWIAAQLAVTDAGLISFDKLMLSFMMNGDKTVYELLIDKHLALEPPKGHSSAGR